MTEANTDILPASVAEEQSSSSATWSQAFRQHSLKCSRLTCQRGCVVTSGPSQFSMLLPPQNLRWEMGGICVFDNLLGWSADLGLEESCPRVKPWESWFSFGAGTFLLTPLLGTQNSPHSVPGPPDKCCTGSQDARLCPDYYRLKPPGPQHSSQVG